jgi:predicted SAM-dependent methyltransferase
MATFLHVGCGHKRKHATTKGFDTPAWTEIRLDNDPKVKPDLVGGITQMSVVETDSMDAIFTSRHLEHLHAHEVPSVMKEFVRVLRPDGYMVINCADLQSVAALIAEDKLMHAAYQSASGPITPLDMVFGLQKSLARGDMHMAHRCGFTQKVLVATLKSCGFTAVASMRRPAKFDLWALASISPRDAEELQALAQSHFPAVIKKRDKAGVVPADVS